MRINHNGHVMNGARAISALGEPIERQSNEALARAVLDTVELRRPKLVWHPERDVLIIKMPGEERYWFWPGGWSRPGFGGVVEGWDEITGILHELRVECYRRTGDDELTVYILRAGEEMERLQLTDGGWET